MDYEKFSDVICYLGNGVSLRFNVVLGRKSMEGTRDFCIKEFKYPDSKYLDKSKLITVKRSFDFYLSIDIKDRFENSVIIRDRDMFNLQAKVRIVFEWFNTLFKIKNKQLIIKGEYTNQRVNLSNSRFIEFEPVVMINQNDITEMGVRLYMNSQDTYVEIAVDNFMAFAYNINTLNLYQTATTVVSGIPFEYGQNIIDINAQVRDPDIKPSQVEGEVQFNPNRKKTKNFFDT